MFRMPFFPEHLSTADSIKTKKKKKIRVKNNIRENKKKFLKDFSVGFFTCSLPVTFTTCFAHIHLGY